MFRIANPTYLSFITIALEKSSLLFEEVTVFTQHLSTKMASFLFIVCLFLLEALGTNFLFFCLNVTKERPCLLIGQFHIPHQLL